MRLLAVKSANNNLKVRVEVVRASRDFQLLVFYESVSPQSPEYTIRAVSNFFQIP
jgi:hypothetical protein